MNKNNNYLPIILFGLLSLLIIFPLLPPGYVMSLDMAPVPKTIWPSIISSSLIYEAFYALFSLFIPSYWLQKIVLFLIFFLTGWGMFKLVPQKLGTARYFGGIFYTINPYVYERFMAGHIGILLGYGFLPFAISQMIAFFDNPTTKSAVKLALTMTLLINLSLHFSIIFLVLLIIYGLVFLIVSRERQKYFIHSSFVLMLFLLVLNFNWFLPFIFGQSALSNAVVQFNGEDLIAFQSVSDKQFGLLFNLISGYGFWAEANNYFILGKQVVFFWPIISLTIVGLFMWGIINYFLNRSTNNIPLLITLIAFFLISLDLAGGIGLSSFRDTVFILYSQYPVLRSFREPQKLVGIIMFCYAFFGSYGLYALTERIIKNRKLILGFFLFLPVVYTPVIFGSFWGQLKPAIYPESWSKVNQLLNKDRDNFLVLSFPWHQYMPFKFSHNVLIANPAPAFFDKEILSSRNYETKYLFSHEDRPEAMHIEGLLAIERKGINLLGEKVEEKLPWGESLAPIGVKYIILAKDDDWKDYSFLMNSSDLEKSFESDEIILYKNLKWTPDF